MSLGKKPSADPNGKQPRNRAATPAKSDNPTKKPAEKRTAPFDPFGITPQFYIKGETETTSWVGCFCTAIEIAITFLVVIFFSRSFSRKQNVDITILNIKSNETPFIDLKQNRQILVLNHYIFGINPETLFPTKAYYVEKDSLKGTLVKTPLEIKLCTELKSDYSDLNLKLQANDILEYQACIEFEILEKPLLIGEDKSLKLKRTIEIEVNPCLANCHQHDFGVIPTGNPLLPLVPMP